MKNSYTDANGVYRNKLGLTDAKRLKEMEHEITSAVSDDILSKRIDLGVSSFGLARQ